ncbi:MAG: hypothetical protein GF317_07580 [Candidatus Lokiarchaeota archaeon]|nr:hypothetical protein [Candidatus Lokiarchaeota archaeon]MBD3199573.1 hypothetical protein [Candidatus Lokiarchaeota archaeon]
MVIITIISISINDSIKNFINKLLSKNEYDNQSKLIRDAILRLMSTFDASAIESEIDVGPIAQRIVGDMIIVVPNESSVFRKLNKIELEFEEHILSKNQHFYDDKTSIFMVFEGEVEDFQKLVVEINSIKELKNFRYLIVN